MTAVASAYRTHQKAIARAAETKAALVAAVQAAHDDERRSWQSIANEVGLSRQRVYEIVNRRGNR